MKNVSINRFLKWIVINGLLSSVLYFALFQNNESAMNLVKFAMWFNFVYIVICIFNVDAVKKVIAEKGESVPTQVNFVYGIVWCSLLAWFGFFWYAAMEAFVTVVQCVIIDLPSKETKCD